MGKHHKLQAPKPAWGPFQWHPFPSLGTGHISVLPLPTAAQGWLREALTHCFQEARYSQQEDLIEPFLDLFFIFHCDLDKLLSICFLLPANNQWNSTFWIWDVSFCFFYPLRQPSRCSQMTQLLCIRRDHASAEPQWLSNCLTDVTCSVFCWSNYVVAILCWVISSFRWQRLHICHVLLRYMNDNNQENRAYPGKCF